MLELPHDVVEKPKRRRGRPHKYPDGRWNRIEFGVSQDTYDKLQAAANFMDMSVPLFVAHILETRAAK